MARIPTSPAFLTAVSRALFARRTGIRSGGAQFLVMQVIRIQGAHTFTFAARVTAPRVTLVTVLIR